MAHPTTGSLLHFHRPPDTGLGHRVGVWGALGIDCGARPWRGIRAVCEKIWPIYQNRRPHLFSLSHRQSQSLLSTLPELLIEYYIVNQLLVFWGDPGRQFRVHARLGLVPQQFGTFTNLYKEIVGTWALMVKVGQDSEPSSPQKGIAIQNRADINGPSRIPIKDQNPQQKKPSGHCKRSASLCFFLRQVWGVPASLLFCFFAFLLFCFFAFLLLCFSTCLLLCFSAFLLSCFSASLPFCFSAFCFSCFTAFLLFLLLCFSAFCFSCFSALLLLCFHCFFAFPLLFCLFSLLFCFFVFPASLLSCFCAFLLLLFYCFFSSVMCFCCSTSCSFASLLPVFTVSLLFIFVCFILSCLYPKGNPRETLGETQRNPKEILIRNPALHETLKKP